MFKTWKQIILEVVGKVTPGGLSPLLSAPIPFTDTQFILNLSPQVPPSLWVNSQPQGRWNSRVFDDCRESLSPVELQSYLVLTSKQRWRPWEMQGGGAAAAHLSFWQSNFLVTSETLLKTSAQLTLTTSNHWAFQRPLWDRRPSWSWPRLSNPASTLPLEGQCGTSDARKFPGPRLHRVGTTSEGMWSVWVTPGRRARGQERF